MATAQSEIAMLLWPQNAVPTVVQPGTAGRKLAWRSGGQLFTTVAERNAGGSRPWL